MFKYTVLFSNLKRVISLAVAALLYSSGVFGTSGLTQFLVRGCSDNPLSIPSYSFYDSTAKVDRNGLIAKKGSYTVYLAGNETEYCQIAFRVRLERRGLRVSLSDFENENGDKLATSIFEEHYIKTNGDTVGGVYPDALIPVADNSADVDMLAQTNYVYLIMVKTDEATVPGDYKASISLTSKSDPDNKYENLTVEVKAHVWDFTLPETPSCATAMGLERGYISSAHHAEGDTQRTQKLYETYYEFLLDHKISAYSLPVDILSDKADKYMDDPRCTSFVIPYGSDDYIRAVYDKLSKNPEWFSKGVFYPIDEPSDEEAYERYNTITGRLERLYPGYNMVTPYYKDKVEINGVSYTSTSLQNGKSNVICPVSNLFSDKDFVDEVHQRQSNGDRLWWYVCCGPAPSSGYCNLFVQYPGIRHRLLFWQQKKLDITGLLYWSTTYWKDVGDPWESAWTTPWTGPDTFGDGSLMYHGYRLGFDGPVSSLRLEAVTNGIEDYEYLVMAERLLGADYVNRIISKVSRDLTDYTYSDQTFAKVRIRLGQAIEEAM